MSHKYGYGVIDTGMLVHEAALWKNVGPHLNYTSPLKVRSGTRGFAIAIVYTVFLFWNSYQLQLSSGSAGNPFGV